MNPILYSNFALFMALISSVVSKDFCDAFVGNNGEISFVLKTNTERAGVVLYNFMINGSYWSTTVDVSQTKPQTLTLNRTDSKSSPAFTGQYYAAVWMTFINRRCAILFAEKLWPNVDSVCNNGRDPDNLANYVKISELPVREVDTITPLDRQEKIVFLQDKHDTKETKLVFVGQSSLGETLSFKRFVIKIKELNDLKLIASEENQSDEDLETFANFKPNLHLIAIVYQWTQFDLWYSHLIFFKDKWIIKWCLTSVKDTIKDECQNNPKLLVNCTPSATVEQVSPTTPSIMTPTPTSDPTEEPANYGLIILIVVVCLVIIVLIGVIVYLCCYSKSKTDLKTNNNSEVSQKSSVSGAEKQPSVVAPTFSTNFGPKK